ncbi:helix-turn-helix domain-containing protein [Streptomyces sp. NPDC049954]|uniref:TetR/AcrR family transcriptional regulator n=1 Tax=Streptomyces sp. NPDC049954 TaxID=3155779 RepID=UPI00343572A5
MAAPPEPDPAPARTAPRERPLRADARRNYERLLAEARTAFAQAGTEASLEDIARRAGVGIGTLYRHFPDRYALMEAVFAAGIAALCAEAEQLSADPALEASEALAGWLGSYVAYATTYGGLSGALAEQGRMTSCHDILSGAAALLLVPAQRAGSVRAAASPHDVLLLTTAVAWAAERLPEGDEEGRGRLLGLVLDGLRTGHRPPPGRPG